MEGSQRFDQDRDAGHKTAEAADEQRRQAAENAGATATSQAAELGSYDYFKGVYPDMDWTPELEVA